MPNKNNPVNTKRIVVIIAIIAAILFGISALAQLGLQSAKNIFSNIDKPRLCYETKNVTVDLIEHVPQDLTLAEVSNLCTGDPANLVTKDSVELSLTSDVSFTSSQEMITYITDGLVASGWVITENQALSHTDYSEYTITVDAHSYEPALAIITLTNTNPSADVGVPESDIDAEKLTDEQKLAYLPFSAFQPTYVPSAFGGKWGDVSVWNDYSFADYQLTEMKDNSSLSKPTLTSRKANPETPASACLRTAEEAANSTQQCILLATTNQGTEIYGNKLEDDRIGYSYYAQIDNTSVELKAISINASEKNAVTQDEIVKIFESLTKINTPAKQ